jgi:glycosyltransferase involved in cell wall biosynthesis
VICVYDTEKYLRKCLDSIINQTYKDLEIIIINDGSPDNSIDIIREYEEIDSRIIVFDIKNCGVSKARNLGLANASGDYIIFIDSDDFLYENMIFELQQKIGDCDMAVCNINRVFDNYVEKPFLNLPKENIISASSIVSKIISEKAHLGGSVCNKLFKLKFLRETGIEFEERSEIYAEDAFFYFKLLKHIDKIAIVNKPLYGYYQRKTSVSNTYKKDFLKRCTNFISRLDDYYDNKYSEEFKIRAFTLFIELIYNESKIGYKNFKKIFQNKYFMDRLLNLDINGFSNTRKMIYYLIKTPLLIYIILKISGRKS